jgi:5-methylcytosine-specific restriction enzyme subunit McrC
MQIPISNLYYILCYAWSYLPEGFTPSVSGEVVDHPVNLFGHVLSVFLERVNRRGIQKGYVDFDEEGNCLRGKLDITRTIGRALLRQGKVACRFDEFSPNILPNQIVKTTALRLLTDPKLDKSLAHNLGVLLQKWEAVGQIELESRLFSLVNIQRQNREYGFLMRLCELIHDALLPVGGSGRYRFKEFIRDEVIMRRVFENFVRNFFKRHEANFRVSSENMNWVAEELSPGAKGVLPILRTDVSLTSGNRKIVIEVKYVPGALQSGHYNKKTLRSSHLYQLVSYLSNMRLCEPIAPEGILLYPAVDEGTAEYRYTILGHRVTVRNLNLNRPWKEIHDDMLKMVAA